MDKKIETNDSEIKSVLVHQSELAGKKNTVDKKIQGLKDELHDAKLEKSQTASHKNTIENKINDNTRKHEVIDNELINLKQSSEKLSKVTTNNTSKENELKILNLSKKREKLPESSSG